MEVGEVIESRQRFVDRRVVFHRAGAQRIKPLVEVEVQTPEPAVMSRDLRLAERRDRKRGAPSERRRHDLVERSRLDTDGWESRARPLLAAQLEKQRLTHARTSR